MTAMLHVLMRDNSADYEAPTMVDVYLDAELAAHNAEALSAAHPSHPYYVEAREPQTVQLSTFTYYHAYVVRLSGEDKLTIRVRPVVEALPELPILPEVTIAKTIGQADNPGYVRHTPFAHVPNTPGGRYLSQPFVTVNAHGHTADFARLQAVDAAMAIDMPPIGGTW